MTLAIDAAPAAMPVNPKIPAIMAIIKKITAHLNITKDFMVKRSVDFSPDSKPVPVAYGLCGAALMGILNLR